MTRSLADELAELVNPAPQAELDPEAAGIADGDALGGSDDELAGLVAGAAGGRRAIAADITLEGGQYSGRRSSRAALFGVDERHAHLTGSSSGDEGGNAENGGAVLVPVHYQASPRRFDVSAVPTMFVNGHLHGRAHHTSSSSSSSEEDEDEEAEQPGSRGGAGGEAAVAGTPTREQQQQHQAADGASDQQAGSSSSEEGEAEAQEEQESEEHQEQDPDMAAAAGSGSDSGREGEAQDESDGSNKEQAGQQQVQPGGPSFDVDAAAAGVTAMLGDDAEMQELEREAAAAQAEAAEQLVAAAGRSGREAAKAAGVRAQQRLWGAALELRIRLQRAVSGANVLPRPAARAALVAGNSQVAARYSELLSSCQATLEELLALHSTLAQQHPAAAAALAAAAPAQQQQQGRAAASKRSRTAAGLDEDEGEQAAAGARSRFGGTCCSASDAWAAVDGAIGSLAGFRDASLDKWHRRTVLSSGTAALRGSSGLRALQQSVSSQVAALMTDKHKLISRSQLPQQLAPRPLGQPAAAQQQEDGDTGDTASGRERDPETYDEGDFYQQLLKELIESAPPGSLPGQLAGARPPKRRKVVDRRASKGRKIRYHTMDKLVGFMAPTELVPPPFAEQLFVNLFSHEG